MSKPAQTNSPAAEGAASKRDLSHLFDEDVEDNATCTSVEVIQQSGSSSRHKPKFVNFDEYAARCFTVHSLEPPVQVMVKGESRKVFNLEMYDPMGNKRFLAVWSEVGKEGAFDNAQNAYAFFL